MNTHQPPPPPDTLNELGVLKRREIEARLLAPLIHELALEFGQERVHEILQRVVVQIAHEQGQALAESTGGSSLADFAAALEAWKKDDAMQIKLLEQTPQAFNFNVTRCRYAEMYRALGIPELGALLSCNRDKALIDGYNPQIKLTRTQTIMEGADFCDFRYIFAKDEGETGKLA